MYDGVCADPAVFGHMMGLDGPPTWKMKKFSKDDFESLIGEVEGSVRFVLLRFYGQNGMLTSVVQV